MLENIDFICTGLASLVLPLIGLRIILDYCRTAIFGK